LVELDDQMALRRDGEVLMGPAGQRWQLAGP
jgi:hypothetical protein